MNRKTYRITFRLTEGERNYLRSRLDDRLTTLSQVVRDMIQLCGRNEGVRI